MRKITALFLIVIFGFICSGCASVTTGPTQIVSIASSPSKANVETDSGYKGTTPTNFKLERNRSHLLTISKEGYKTAQVVLSRTMSGAVAGNIIIGGIIGVGVDAMTGAMFKLVPENVYVALEKGDPGEIIAIKGAEAHKEFRSKISTRRQIKDRYLVVGGNEYHTESQAVFDRSTREIVAMIYFNDTSTLIGNKVQWLNPNGEEVKAANWAITDPLNPHRRSVLSMNESNVIPGEWKVQCVDKKNDRVADEFVFTII